MKYNPNSKVSHVSLVDIINLVGRPLRRNIFDGKESTPGIKMQLCPGGVLCQHEGKTFIIPLAACATVVLSDEEDRY